MKQLFLFHTKKFQASKHAKKIVCIFVNVITESHLRQSARRRQRKPAAPWILSSRPSYHLHEWNLRWQQTCEMLCVDNVSDTVRRHLFPSSSWSCQCPCGCGSVKLHHRHHRIQWTCLHAWSSRGVPISAYSLAEIPLRSPLKFVILVIKNIYLQDQRIKKKKNKKKTLVPIRK